MTPKRRRFVLLLAALGILSLAAVLALTALRDNVVFFYSPTEIQAKAIKPGQRIRVGGLVEEGSVVRTPGTSMLSFRITDLSGSIPVVYDGILPDLFREGQGVVAEGALQPDGAFRAERVLAKHDETYMPPEVADALKKSGQWRGGAPTP
jgi:cytochrome c-type biogenesis protein CcmE